MFTVRWLREWWCWLWRSERGKETDIGCTGYVTLHPASHPQPELSPSCPRLDEYLVSLLVPRFLKEYGILPMERVNDRIIFACWCPLTSSEIEGIRFRMHRADFDFVYDPHRYPDVYAHFDELVAHYSWEPYTVDAMFATE